MSWRPIDFQGIVDLDPKIVEHLEQFLQEKENRLAQKIAHAIQSLSTTDTAAPILPAGASFKLSEAVEGLSKKLRLYAKNLSENPPEQDNGFKTEIVDELSKKTPYLTKDSTVYQKAYGIQAIKDMNAALWEYTEVLEGCAIELFQQVRQVPIDRWHLSILEVVQATKDVLLHRLEDAIWAIHRLEKPLKEYFKNNPITNKKWSDWIPFKKAYIDPQLLRHLEQSENYLKNQDSKFKQRYADYMLLSAKAEESLEDMKNYPILALLDISDQNLYIDVFRLLKMQEVSRATRKETTGEMTRALKHLTSIDHVLRVMRIYYRGLKDAFFNSSFEWKSLDWEDKSFKEAQQKLQTKVQDYQHELRHLIHTMSRYRQFILKNDPNPYVRSRWGFTEWIVGPEPIKAKDLRNLIYEAEELEPHFTQLTQSLSRDPLKQQHLEYQAHREIETLLHEMGQPLMSRSMMRNRAERLLNQLKSCDEMGSPYMSTVFYVDDVFSKVMREDWKYHVLHEFPLFHQMYHFHQGMAEYFEDPAHAFRLDHFNLLFNQIEEWVDKQTVYAHVHEIELDINDMKTYLQDFLASIQRVVKDKSQDPFLDETIQRFRQQLLEYRYLFGQFFSHMMAKNTDGLQLRHQFLFVDQYFDTIENLLTELKVGWEGKR